MRAGAAVLAGAVVAVVSFVGGAARDAHADPLFGPPVLGKARWGGEEGDVVIAGLVLDVRLLGIAGARRLSIWPDRELALTPGEPVAASVRAGGVLHLVDAPWSFVLQLDLAEPMRPSQAGVAPWQESFGAFAGAVVDDAYVMWRPARAANLVLGRARVPFSKWRQYDERDIALGAVPFVVDRVTPDRRWGLLFHGDLGALAYAAGAWEDLDALEPRLPEDDPSADGQMLAGLQLEWTPIAPMMGSNPVGKVVGARGPLPTPRSDPWFDTHRFSLGLGALYRRNQASGQRFDAAVSLQWKWNCLAALAEGLVLDGRRLGAHAELAATPIDAVSIHARAEWDPGEKSSAASTLPSHSAWTLGGGIMWHATADRRSRIGFYGWYRRVSLGPDRASRPEDAAIVLIQTAL